MFGDLFYLLFLIPQFVLLIFGIVMITRARRGRASTLGMIGCLVLLLNAVFDGVRSLATPWLADQFGFASISMVFSALGLVSTVLYCTGLGLLIWSAASKNPSGPAAWQPGQPQGAPGWQQGWQGQPQQAHSWPQQQAQPGQQPQPGQGWQEQPQPQPPYGQPSQGQPPYGQPGQPGQPGQGWQQPPPGQGY